MTGSRCAISASCLILGAISVACRREGTANRLEAPPELKVQRVTDRNVFEVENAELFKLTKATLHTARSELRVTGTVNADVSRNVPVISLAAGRVLTIHAQLGDTVTKGQLLLTVQSTDISSAYNDYQQAIADEALARKQLDRSKALYGRGAVALKELEVAEATQTKANVTIRTTLERLRVLGVNPDHPSAIVEIRAPVSGVITDQQVTNAAGVQALGPQNPFTISDLSHVWIVCDVFESDLRYVRLGEKADIRLDGYPDRLFTGTINNIGPILDPNIRTAKVRIQMPNPGLMRIGMFVTAVFYGPEEKRTAAPAPAILHWHDRDWVYVPLTENQFRQVEVVAGNMLPEGMQEILTGISPGQQVVANALAFQTSVQR
jgi:cobalt-zinc-cadmium efflux system membrane fusion protein